MMRLNANTSTIEKYGNVTCSRVVRMIVAAPKGNVELRTFDWKERFFAPEGM